MFPDDQAPSGYVLIDKPVGWSSHDVVAKIRRILGVKRIGHAGTLDPIATGLLIVLVGREFTKQQTLFLKKDKEYEVVFELGWTTDTYDATGTKITQADWVFVKKIRQEQLQNVLNQWLGTHSQQVPAFSAVKYHGRKLYQLARHEQASLPELPTREVTFYQLDLQSMLVDETSHSYQVTIRVVCSSGTYIRSLVHDLGQELQVGATMTALRRTKIGAFSVLQAVSPHLVTATSLMTNI